MRGRKMKNEDGRRMKICLWTRDGSETPNQLIYMVATNYSQPCNKRNAEEEAAVKKKEAMKKKISYYISCDHIVNSVGNCVSLEVA